MRTSSGGPYVCDFCWTFNGHLKFYISIINIFNSIVKFQTVGNLVYGLMETFRKLVLNKKFYQIFSLGLGEFVQ